MWIVQARPITVGTAPATDTEWTRANLAEVLPEHTSPQTLDVVERLLNVAEQRYMGRLIAPYDELGPMTKPFYGRLYFNLTQLRRVCRVTGTPPAAVLRSLGHSGHLSPEDERAPWPGIGEFLPAVQAGVIRSELMREISGIVASRQNPGVLWVHNDSGDRPRIYAIDTKGDLLGICNVGGATERDWEDIAIGPGPVDPIAVTELFGQSIHSHVPVVAGPIVVVVERDLGGAMKEWSKDRTTYTLHRVVPMLERQQYTLIVHPG